MAYVSGEERAQIGDTILTGRPIPANVTEVADSDSDPWWRIKIDDEHDMWIFKKDPDAYVPRSGEKLSRGIGPLEVLDVEPWCDVPSCDERHPHAHAVADPAVTVPVSPDALRTYPTPTLDVDKLLQLIEDHATAINDAGYGGQAAAVHAKIVAMLKPREPRTWPALDPGTPPDDLTAVHFVMSGMAPASAIIVRRTVTDPSGTTLWESDLLDEPMSWAELRLYDLTEVIEP